MTSRRTGKRVAARRRTRTVKQPKIRRAAKHQADPLSPRERRALLRLVICGSAFVLMVAVKLLLPARMEQLQVRLGEAMEQNMDVRAVFSAVGRAFSGESELVTAANEVYQAVFHPEGEAVKTSIQVPVAESETALDTLRNYRSTTEQLADTAVLEQAETEPLSYILYSEQNLPESVSMEQVILGFEYEIPVAGTISSDFGYRDHPLEGEEKFHYGIDLVADRGTEIRCFADGTVIAVGDSSSYGKYCTVEHENGCSTLYAHCDRITVSSGSVVQAGEKIAEVGETGMATGPHLHFELLQNGTYLNPIYYVSEL